MIDGLKLTVPGTRLQELLDERIQWHENMIEHFTRELARAVDDRTGEVRVPEHMIEHERDEHTDRRNVLELIREHVEAAETYRLTENDLRFADLLPDNVCW